MRSSSVKPEKKINGVMHLQLKTPNSDYNESLKSPNPDTSDMFLKRSSMNKEQVEDHVKNIKSNKDLDDIPAQRRFLHIGAFIAIILMESAFTLYPAFTFSKTSGEYEFIAVQFSFSIAFFAISYYLTCSKTQMALLYSLLDPLLIIQVCLSATYIFPFYALSREQVGQILEQIGFVECNFCMVGNFRVMLLRMKWSTKRVITYKLIKVVWIMFYLFFGAYYILASVSYSEGKDSTLDSHVQNLVTLFVFSGFALQLQVYNRIADFDGSSSFKTDYIILDQGEKPVLDSEQQSVLERNKAQEHMRQSNSPIAIENSYNIET